MGNKSSKKSDGIRSESRTGRKRTSFKDSIRSLTNRKPKEPDEIPEDKGPKVRLEVPVENYSFPFENVVFQGGGYKCLAHCGAVRCLEELGIWRCVRRIAGTSSGALVAALLAMGYNSYQLERYLSQDLLYLFTDQCCGSCCLASNLRSRLGFHPGRKFSRWLGDRLKDACGDPDITFQQVYESYDRELCIAVTNVSTSSVTYCHPKTTPDMSVRAAVRMSLTIPGASQPVQFSSNDFMEYYTDGGLICNYPVHCFDGWWLSLRPGDSHIERLGILAELSLSLDRDSRFSGYNERTLGFMVYGDGEVDGLQSLLDDRHSSSDVKQPDTALAKTKKEKTDARKYAADKFADLSLALQNFLKALKENGLDEQKLLSRNDLHNIISKRTELSEIDLRVLFGKNYSVESIFKELKVDKSNSLDIPELIRHVDKRAMRYVAHYTNYRRRNITSLRDYILSLNQSALNGGGLASVRKPDMDRTVGINTYHVTTSDLDLEKEDRKFLVERGKASCKTYLEWHVSQRLPQQQSDKGDLEDADDMTQFYDDELSEIIDTRDYMEDIGQVI